MRALILLAILVGGCTASDPIEKAASPVGCWLSSPDLITLKSDGALRHVHTGGTTSGTWQLQDGALVLFEGGAQQRWEIVDLTASDMWTDGGEVRHWQSVACSE